MRFLDSRTDDVIRILSHRAAVRDAETERIVAATIDDVRQRGDAALLDSARRFDSPSLESVLVSESELDSAQVSAAENCALAHAGERIEAFHRQQASHILAGCSEVQGGIREWRANGEFCYGVGQRVLPLGRAGIYVPGGNAAYPSSVLMNVLPAKAAGVAQIVVTSPARRDGTLPPAVLVAMRICGIRHAVKVGGAAAIAALALGTESIPRVDKVAGPGNRWVNEAKRQLWGQVGVDGYAGPSEVCVLADEEANPAFAAADLLTQIEHASDNVAFLIILSETKRDEILAKVEHQLAGAPRESTLRQALAENSVAVVARDLAEACDVANAIAPEHLTLAAADPQAILGHIRNAGCILLGESSPESAGDYVAGPSHTLPTGGAARWQSPVNVLDFIKLQSIIDIRPSELEGLIPTIETLANLEGFPAHGFGATVRRS
jgi:histidinol dehydrogenase